MAEASANHSPIHTREIALVLALLALTVLGAFVGVDGGNMWGVDEWPTSYAASRSALSYYVNRPLAILPIYLGYQVAGNAPLPGLAVTLLYRVALALLVYLLLREYAPRQRLFAYASAAFTLAFLVRDFFLLWAFTLVGNLYGVSVLALLALYLQVRHVRSGRLAYLLGGIAVLLVAVLVYEAVVPLLLGVPWLALVLERDFSRRRLVNAGVWSAAVVAVSAWYALPLLGLREASYGSTLFTGLSPAVLLGNTITQFRAFEDLPLITVEQLRSFWPALPLGAAVVVAGYLIAARYLPEPAAEAPVRRRVSQALLWLVVGLVTTFLGFAAYLPTLYGALVERIHVTAAPGEGVLLASLAWLAGSFFPARATRRTARALIFALIAVVGLYNINAMQAVNDSYQGIWDSDAVFLRGLAHLIPAAEPNTLLVLVVDDPAADPPPFTNGFAFQYAVRYLYEDSVLAAVTQGGLIAHELIVDDSGLQMILAPGFPPANPMAHPSQHAWDEVIFLRQDEHGRPVILDTLPEQYAAPGREALYDPQARIIRSAPLPPRVLRLLPPLQSTTAAPDA